MNTEKSIKEIMTVDIITIDPGDTLLKLEEIYQLMPIHHVLVVKNNELLGVVSKMDLLNIYRKELLLDKVLDRSQILIRNIMTPNPITLDCDDTIGLAADIFLANKFHSIPILDGDELVGIVTNHDLIKYAYS